MIRYTPKQLKHLAMKSLNGKMNIFLSAYLIYFVINSLSSYLLSAFTGINELMDYETGELLASTSDLAIYLISSYIISLILSVLDLGFNKMFLDGSREQPISWKMLFYGFQHQPDRVLIFQLILGGITLVSLAPGYLLVMTSNWIGGNFILAVIGLIVFLLGFFPVYYFNLVFSQGMLLMADHENASAVWALKESNRMMKGHKMRYFLLDLSFIGLQLLCYITCNLGTLFLYPYLGMTRAMFYRNLTGEIGKEESVLYT